MTQIVYDIIALRHMDWFYPDPCMGRCAPICTITILYDPLYVNPSSNPCPAQPDSTTKGPWNRFQSCSRRVLRVSDRNKQG